MVYDMVMKKSHFGRHDKIQLNYFLITKMYIQYDAILLFFFTFPNNYFSSTYSEPHTVLGIKERTVKKLHMSFLLIHT